MQPARKELALARLLAAAAWADGRLELEEVNAIKDCMLRLGLSGDEVQEVAHLLESPVPWSQAETLAAEFLGAVQDDGERKELLQHLTTLTAADGATSREEREFLTMVKSMIESRSSIDRVLDRVRGLFTWGALRPTQRRPSSVADALRTRLQERVRQRLAEVFDPRTGAQAETLNRAVLFGALLQRVACADGTVAPDEAERIGEHLRERYAYSPEEIATITATLCEQVTGDVDLHRLAVEFNRVSDLAGRMDLLHAMFEVASADRGVTEREVDEIRRIADYLWIDRREFNDVRLQYAR